MEQRNATMILASCRLPGEGKKMRFALKILLYLGCIFVGGSDFVFGYVIEGPQIIQLMARNIGRASTLQVNQRLTTYVFDQQTRMESAKEVVRYIFPDVFRTDTSSEDTNRIFLAQGERSLAVVNAKVEPQAENEMDLYHFLLLHHKSDGLTRFLESYGIDTNISSLGKFEKRVAYVIGVQYPDEDHSQLWVDKETFLPMRWELVALVELPATPSNQTESSTESDQGETDQGGTDQGEMGQGEADQVEADQVPPDQASPDSADLGGKTLAYDRLEFRFALWRKFDRLYYPQRVTIYSNGLLRREVRVDDVVVNPKLDKAMMDLDRQAALYPKPKPAWNEDSNPDENTDDIQKTIDNFKKKFE